MSEVDTELDEGSVLLTTRETMRFLEVRSRNTLWSWEQRRHGPMPINIGSPDATRRTVRYRRSDLLDFIGEKP
jgi:hypothetical protein